MAFLAAFLLLFSDVTRNQKLRWAWKWKWWWQKKENDMYSFELLMKKKAKIPSFIQAFGAARREQLVWLQVPSPGQEPARVPAGWLPVEMQVLNIKLLTLTTTGQNRALQLLRLPFLLPFLLLRSPPTPPPQVMLILSGCSFDMSFKIPSKTLPWMGGVHWCWVPLFVRRLLSQPELFRPVRICGHFHW